MCAESCYIPAGMTSVSSPDESSLTQPICRRSSTAPGTSTMTLLILGLVSLILRNFSSAQGKSGIGSESIGGADKSV